MPRSFRYAANGSIGRRNLPCSIVNARNLEVHRRAIPQQQQRVQQRQRVLAARKRHRHAIAVANHLETADGLADFAQQDLLKVHASLSNAETHGRREYTPWTG